MAELVPGDRWVAVTWQAASEGDAASSGITSMGFGEKKMWFVCLPHYLLVASS